MREIPPSNEHALKVIDGGASDEPNRKKKSKLISDSRPRIFVSSAHPERCVDDLARVIGIVENIYVRGVPVEIVQDRQQGHSVTSALTPEAIVLIAHRKARPYGIATNKDGDMEEVAKRLPRTDAQLYLSMALNWLNLRNLKGVTTALPLRSDGTIWTKNGYEPESEFYVENAPDISGKIADKPTKEEAKQALLTLRCQFRTFAFADAETKDDVSHRVVDTEKPPGEDESAFLCTLLTAVCRASIDCAPGALIAAAALSGAGSGKGKLARCIAAIAYGRQPSPISPGQNQEEMEKVIASAFIDGEQMILLDNFNDIALKSNTLDMALTEGKARVRPLGKSVLVTISATSLVIVTGNNLRISADGARRFIRVMLDAKMEDPESREFDGDIVEQIMERRAELLAACLTIWRYGRQNKLTKGKRLGSYETWGEWVRDPLLALGCKDPAARIAEAKEDDPKRQRTFEILSAWWAAHQGKPTTAAEVADSVKHLLDPKNTGSRQIIAAAIARLRGVRIGGFAMSSNKRKSDKGEQYAPTEYTLTQEKHEELL